MISLIVDCRLPEGFGRNGAHQRLHSIHGRSVVRIGFIPLEPRKFRVVQRGSLTVPEEFANLEDSLMSGRKEALSYGARAKSEGKAGSGSGRPR